jgi:hypothetical protein
LPRLIPSFLWASASDAGSVLASVLASASVWVLV